MQINQTVIDQLNTIAQELIDKKAAFTGYDVTRLARERYALEIRHKWVREYIHNLPSITQAMQADYEFTVIEICNCQCGNQFVASFGGCPKCGGSSSQSQGPAILYHPFGYDVATHRPDANIHPIPQALTAPVKQLVDETPKPVTDQPTTSAQAVYQDQLIIPSSFVQLLGLAPLDSCFVFYDAAQRIIQLSKHVVPQSTGLMVEWGGEVKIPLYMTDGIFTNGDKYQITRNNALVEIKYVE
jgi:hypothetical protein